MLVSFGLIIIFGLIFGFFCKKLKIPALIGMLFTGIKAGLSLDISDLKRIGKSAILLSFLPASFEILAYFIFARIFFKIRSVDALLMGSVLAAVSPAVVVPRMVKLIEEKRGVNKSIPQMILAGSSICSCSIFIIFVNGKGRRCKFDFFGKCSNFYNFGNYCRSYYWLYFIYRF